jgi:hypothetical protein
MQNSVDILAQVVEHLPSKCEALSSNTNTVPKKKNVHFMITSHYKE